MEPLTRAVLDDGHGSHLLNMALLSARLDHGARMERELELVKQYGEPMLEAIKTARASQTIAEVTDVMGKLPRIGPNVSFRTGSSAVDDGPNAVVLGKGARRVVDGVEINELGGKHSYVPERYDLVDGRAMKVLAGVLGTGARKYAVDNWRLIPVADHVNHALAHLYAHLDTERRMESGGEDDLGHALCRLLFAVAMREQSDADQSSVPDSTLPAGAAT